MAAPYSAVPWYVELLMCRRCPVRDEALRVVPGDGPLDAGICLIGQNPGAEEDERGIPFVGEAGDELNQWLQFLRLDRAKLLITNALKCHTTRNRPPRPKELATCQTWMAQELTTFTELQVLIPLGRPALSAIAGKVVGIPPVMSPWWMTVVFGERELHLLPLPHPSYLLRYPNQRPLIYQQLLPEVQKYLETKVPDVYARSQP